MSFIHNTQDELKNMGIKENMYYLVEYLNKDYFNGEENIEKTRAKALFIDGQIVFVVTDPYGMERYVEKVKILK